MFNSNTSNAFNCIFVVNYHYKVIDFSQISFLNIASCTNCIPINPMNAQDENGRLFPPLWELELEIFNCDSAINLDCMRKTMENDNVTTSDMDSSVATNSPKMVMGRHALVKESTLNSSNKDVSDTGLMFENLMISNPFHATQYVLDDIPCELKSLKIN